MINILSSWLNKGYICWIYHQAYFPLNKNLQNSINHAWVNESILFQNWSLLEFPLITTQFFFPFPVMLWERIFLTESQLQFTSHTGSWLWKSIETVLTVRTQRPPHCQVRESTCPTSFQHLRFLKYSLSLGFFCHGQAVCIRPASDSFFFSHRELPCWWNSFTPWASLISILMFWKGVMNYSTL